jgi:hypothetical protein
MRCHRCNDPMTLYVIGDDYCPPCKREIKVRDEADARRARFAIVPRYSIAKDMTQYPHGAA